MAVLENRIVKLIHICIFVADIANGIVLQSLHPLHVPIEGGAPIYAHLRDTPPDGEPITCNIVWRTDSWAFTVPKLNGSNDANVVKCPPMLPLPAEGPVDFFIQVGDDVSNKLMLWTFATFSASMGKTPYYGTDQGEILIKINDTSAVARVGVPAYTLSATTADGAITLLDNIPVLGGDVKRALPVSFRGIADPANVTVNLTLRGVRSDPLKLNIQLIRFGTAPVGAVSVDHSTRGILVDGRPFFPISWMTNIDLHGVESVVKAMALTAQRGANSIMIYELGRYGLDPESDTYGPKFSDVYEVLRVMDAAQAMGLKVQMDLRSFVIPITKTGGSQALWAHFENFVQTWKDHPALLAWYVADDLAFGDLSQVYSRLKKLDPFHLVTMAIAGIGYAWRPVYLRFTDVVMPENYVADPKTSWDTMHVMSYFPYDWAPRITCGMGFDQPVTSTAMFRTELYNSVVAGATGTIWFAYSFLPGEHHEPGPLLDASGDVSKEMLELVPSLLATEVIRDPIHGLAQPALVSVTGVTQEGNPALVHASAHRETSGCIHLLLVNNVNEPVQASIRFAPDAFGVPASDTLQATGVVPFEKSLPGAARFVHIRDGLLREWLPSWGTQVLRFNGTSTCATLPTLDLLEPSNFVLNPSFEHSLSYVASPDAWWCGVSSLATDRSCFADSSIAKVGRRSGRFASGSDFGTFRVRVPIKGIKFGQRYAFSAWLRGDVSGQTVTLKRTPLKAINGVQYWQYAQETDITSVAVNGDWALLNATVVIQKTTQPLWSVWSDEISFALSKPGTLWIDSVQLRLSSGDAHVVIV